MAGSEEGHKTQSISNNPIQLLGCSYFLLFLFLCRTCTYLPATLFPYSPFAQTGVRFKGSYSVKVTLRARTRLEAIWVDSEESIFILILLLPLPSACAWV